MTTFSVRFKTMMSGHNHHSYCCCCCCCSTNNGQFPHRQNCNIQRRMMNITTSLSGGTIVLYYLLLFMMISSVFADASSTTLEDRRPWQLFPWSRCPYAPNEWSSLNASTLATLTPCISWWETPVLSNSTSTSTSSDTIITWIQVTPAECYHHRDGAALAVQLLNPDDDDDDNNNNYQLISIVAGSMEEQSDYTTTHATILQQVLSTLDVQAIIGTCSFVAPIEPLIAQQYETVLLAQVGPPSFYQQYGNPYLFGMHVNSNLYPTAFVQHILFQWQKQQQQQQQWFMFSDGDGQFLQSINPTMIHVMYETTSDFFISTCQAAIDRFQTELGHDNVQIHTWNETGRRKELEFLLRSLAKQVCHGNQSDYHPVLLVCTGTEALDILVDEWQQQQQQQCHPYALWATAATFTTSTDITNTKAYWASGGQWHSQMEYADDYFDNGRVFLEYSKKQLGYAGTYDQVVSYSIPMVLAEHTRQLSMGNDDNNNINNNNNEDDNDNNSSSKILKREQFRQSLSNFQTTTIFGPIYFDQRHQRNVGRQAASTQWLLTSTSTNNNAAIFQNLLVAPLYQAQAALQIPAPSALPCPSGYFWNITGWHERGALLDLACQPCPVDTYLFQGTNDNHDDDVSKPTSCTECPMGSTTNNRLGQVSCVQIEQHDISTSVYSFGMVATVLSWACSLACLGWIMWFGRHSTIIQVSQWEFLTLICMGTLVSTSTLLALTMGRQDDDNINRDDDDQGNSPSLSWESAIASAGCKVAPFLYGIGWTLQYASLSVKTFRLYKVRQASNVKKNTMSTTTNNDRKQVVEALLPPLEEVELELSERSSASSTSWSAAAAPAAVITTVPNDGTRRGLATAVIQNNNNNSNSNNTSMACQRYSTTSLTTDPAMKSTTRMESTTSIVGQHSSETHSVVQTKDEDISFCRFFQWVIKAVVIDFALILAMTLVNPLEYTQEEKATSIDPDTNVLTIELVGRCRVQDPDGVSVWAFAGPILAFHILLMAVTTYLLIQVRHMGNKFQESKYIAIACIVMLETIAIGIPLLLAVKDYPTGIHVVLTVCIALHDMVILGVIFLPKILNQRKESRRRQQLLQQQEEEQQEEQQQERAMEGPLHALPVDEESARFLTTIRMNSLRPAGMKGKGQTTSQWDQAVATINELLYPMPKADAERDTEGQTAVIPEKTREQLEMIKSLLMQQGDTKQDKVVHLPLNLIRRNVMGAVKGVNQSMHAVKKGLKPIHQVSDTARFILKEYGGYNTAVAHHDGVGDSGKLRSRRLPVSEDFECDLLEYVLPEFMALSRENQMRLFRLLSWSSLKRWEFNVFDLLELTNGKNPLLFVGWAILGSPHSQYAMGRQCGVMVNLEELRGYNFADETLRIPAEPLCDYLRVIEQDYKETNPYHNAIHAADIVQTIHTLVQMIGNSFSTTKLDIFAILLSAVVHDVKHPGENNSFQANARTDLALLYNDSSILENRHIAHAFQVMLGDEAAAAAGATTATSLGWNKTTTTTTNTTTRRLSHINHGASNSLNPLVNVSSEQLKIIRGKMIDAVLHTDMSKHFATVSSMKALVMSHSEGRACEQSIQDEESSWKILCFMLHLADISNPAKPDPLFKIWTERCLEEFFAQGDKEKKLGLPISPNCDRTKTKRPDSQLGFIAYVILPAYEVLGMILNPVEEWILPIIQTNLRYWRQQKEQMEMAQQGESTSEQ